MTRQGRTIIKRWKLNNKEGWEKFNTEMKSLHDKNEIPLAQKDLQETIIKLMKETVGQTTIRTGSNKPKRNREN